METFVFIRPHCTTTRCTPNSRGPKLLRKRDGSPHPWCLLYETCYVPVNASTSWCATVINRRCSDKSTGDRTSKKAARTAGPTPTCSHFKESRGTSTQSSCWLVLASRLCTHSNSTVFCGGFALLRNNSGEHFHLSTTPMLFRCISITASCCQITTYHQPCMSRLSLVVRRQSTPLLIVIQGCGWHACARALNPDIERSVLSSPAFCQRAAFWTNAWKLRCSRKATESKSYRLYLEDRHDWPRSLPLPLLNSACDREVVCFFLSNRLVTKINNL